MPQPTNTWDGFDIVGWREDLSNMISNISPTDTPFISNARKESCSNRYFEWQTDSLAAANGANAHIPGDDSTASALSPTVRVGNRTQTMRKDFVVEDGVDSADTAGRAKETGYQIAKNAAELKRDEEAVMLANVASDAGSSSAAPRTAGLPAWLTSNVDRDTVNSGASGGFSGGTVSAATDASDDRVWTGIEDQIRGVMQSAYDNGGQPKTIMCGTYGKMQLTDNLNGIATLYRDVGVSAATVVGATDVYVSDFGELMIVPNRFQRARDLYLLDWDKVCVSTFRPYKLQELGKTGDSTKYMMLCEKGLKVDNEASHGVVADLDAVAP
ncbi:MAG: DUF5309 family protein [Pseudomonadota bacterium]